ncbi:hypothetical protein LSAT2_022567 [Lamellibrachia satsuma]|nr:hypothetical protein LSAT2_022567 [Lamellibrachia satsuma]
MRGAAARRLNAGLSFDRTGVRGYLLSFLDFGHFVHHTFHDGAAVFYIVVCFKCKADTQLTIGGYMTTIYAILMLAVTVGIVVQTAQDTWTSPNAMFIMIVVGIFTLAGFLHPEEFMCLVPGILYFLCIPSGFILLFIYSMVNMNVVSWGTREIPQTTDPQSDDDKDCNRKGSRFMRELKRILVNICCCIKQRCVNFIDERSAAASTQPKRQDIVQEIIAELGKLESGSNGGDGQRPVTSPPPTYAIPTTSGGSRDTDVARMTTEVVCESTDGRPRIAEASYSRPAISRSLLEERQRSIVRQLDSIHQVAL